MPSTSPPTRSLDRAPPPPFQNTVFGRLAVSLALCCPLAAAGLSIDGIPRSIQDLARWFPQLSSESPAGADPRPLQAGNVWTGDLNASTAYKPMLLLSAASLLCLLGIGYRARRRSKQVQKSRFRQVSLVLSIMGFLVSTSFLLLVAVFQPESALGQYGYPTGSGSAAATTMSQIAVHTVPASADIGQNVLPNIRDPEAVDPQAVCPGYKASNVKDTDRGFTADLDLAGKPCNVYGNDVEHLSLSVGFQTDGRLHVEIQPRYIGPRNETWFILPEVLIPRPPNGPADAASNRLLDISWSNSPSFSLTVKRKETGDTLFTTKGSVLVYEDQFIEFVSSLPDNYNLYGLGESMHSFRLGDNVTRTLFAADVGNDIDRNIYGSHPIYLDTRYFTADASNELAYVPNPTDKAKHYVSYTHGVFLRNAHAQEILLKPARITWRTLGGSIDLYFYAGPNTQDIIKDYQYSAVGLPALQQYWTLGYHQCRWGYDNWTVVQDVVDNFAKFEIPLETIWTDLDYMKAYRDFENDPVRFSYNDTAKFLHRLHANHQHYVPIVDSAIYAPNPNNPDDAYAPFDRGVKAKAFMLNPDGSVYIGAVWPGYTVFPDWIGAVLNGTGAIDWWIHEISMWSEKVAFDGIWIDMSEVASFCVGSCGSGKRTLNPASPPFELMGQPGNMVYQYPEGFELTNASEAASASSAAYAQSLATTTSTAAAETTTAYYRTKPTPGARNINWPPYAINNFHGDLAVHAVSPNATHHGGYLEYDFHNLFGHQILNATYHALLRVYEGKRPFLIGRSTFAGSGKWAGHWGGDNESIWAFLYFSIPQALSFSIFGVPMFGVDACGFNGNTNYELCSRWMQLSAFFPFYRNHNTLGAIGQEPYIWAGVIDASKSAMRIRYALLPYLYTLMVQAHLDGSTVMRALSWEFPEEPWLAAADRQFLLGPAVMVTPVLVQGATTVNGVFPGVGDGKTLWYDWYTSQTVTGVERGENVTIQAPLGHIPVYLRGGHVLPLQEPALTTYQNRQNPWSLIAALDAHGKAEGSLYLDDGESLKPSKTTWVEFSASKGSLHVKPTGDYVDENALTSITVLGLDVPPQKVLLNGKDELKWVYEQGDAPAKGVLKLEGLDHRFKHGAWSDGWEITWA